MPARTAVATRTVDETTAYFGEIVKFNRDANGDLEVYGKATGTNLDSDGQRMNGKWLAKAMPDWMTWGNIREQHNKIAAGVGRELTAGDNGDWMLKSLCTDPVTAHKIETGTLKGYSINVLGARVTKGTPSTPGGEIVGGMIGEISYVDRPCLDDATLSLCKAAGGMVSLAKAAAPGADLEPVDAPAGAVDETNVDDETLDGDEYDDDEFVPPGAVDDETTVPPKLETPDVDKMIGQAVNGQLVEVVKALAASVAGMRTEITSLNKARPRKAKKAETTTVPVIDKATGTVDDTTTELTKALAKATAPLEAMIKSLQSDLAKVKATPLPGAPIIMGAPRPRTPELGTSRRAEYLAKASGSRVSAEVAEMWRMLAASEPAEA